MRFRFQAMFLSPITAAIEEIPGSLHDDGTGGGEFFSTESSGRTWDVLLTTEDNPGPRADIFIWSWSLVADGALDIVDITTSGTVSCSPGWPTCLLAGGSLNQGIATVDGVRGAFQAIALTTDHPVSIPPTGTVAVAKLRVAARFPETPGERTAGGSRTAPRFPPARRARHRSPPDRHRERRSEP